MRLCNVVKDAIGFLDECPKFSQRSSVTLALVEKTRKLWHAIGHFLVQAWNRGLDGPDARRQFESRARRIFNAIMTDRCGDCLAPITLCRQAH
jgi:hypothetical protein